MNNKYNKVFPLLLTIILIICIITGMVISKKYLEQNSNFNEVIKDDIPKLDINSNEENVENEEVIIEDKEEIDSNQDSTQQENDKSNKDTTVNNNQNNNTSKPITPSKPQKPANNNKDTENENKDTENDNKDNDSVNDVVPVIPTQDELNDSFRNSIYNTYGVKIAYGNEMNNYLIGYYAPTKMTDPVEINEYLTRIEKELKKYPNRFFKEMKEYGMPLTIYVVKDIPNSDLSGLTDSQIYSNVIISLKSGLLFEKTLNHELMHYIDAYLNSKLYPNTVDIEWNKLNPTEYIYGSFNTDYDYFPSQNNNAYFFSNYSQTNYKEDRATLFEDIMTRSYKRPCYNEGYPLYNKIKLLANQIDEGFDSVNSDTIEYWELFL